jgi:hypothetical protein
MRDVSEKVMRLIALAVNDSATQEEARTAALAACKLIASHDLKLVAGQPPSSEAASPPRAASPRSRSASRPSAASTKSERGIDWDSFMSDFFANYDWSDSPRSRVKVKTKSFCTHCSAEIDPGSYAYDLPRTADRICTTCHDEGVGDDLEGTVL